VETGTETVRARYLTKHFHRAIPVKILFLALDIDLGRQRGDSIHALSLARALTRSGHRVHLVVGATDPAMVVPGLEISVRAVGGDLSVIRQVWRVSRRFQPDVIYERRFSPKVSAALSMLTNTPYVVECNGIVEEEAAMQGRPLTETPWRRLKASIRALTLRRAAAIVAVATGLSDALVERYGVSRRRVSVIENGVDPVLFQPRIRDSVRTLEGFGTDPIICFVGNLVAWQGLESLLYALRDVPRPVRLLVVGDGPDRQRLAGLVRELALSERVEFLGTVPHQKIPDYIALSNLCVAPFIAKRNQKMGISPLKVFEYLACARPVVVTDIPGARELVESTGAGIVVAPDEPVALKEAIGRVLIDPAFSVAAVRASDIVRRDHSWDGVATAVVRVLTAAASRRARPIDSLAGEAHGEF